MSQMNKIMTNETKADLLAIARSYLVLPLMWGAYLSGYWVG